MNKPLDDNLGRYQIVSLIARGGMAEVYKAYQPGLDRYVAIKVLHPHLADEPGFINRFEREAASVARLRHPNIVQVIDFDCQEGRYYMVMEYIEGASLKAELVAREERGEAYTPQEAAYVISGVASALDYAHGRGMVHRDIKPGNILFTGEGQVVLADFGIAHIVGTTLYTESAGALGTPAYLSPEQARGGMGDTRSDIYSLGVVLYQMLVGRLPYEADTPLGLLQQHIEGQLPAPREIKPELAEDVEVVILKALAKQPEERYQSTGEMGEALLEAVGLSVDQTVRIPTEELEEATEEAAKPLPPCPYRGLFAFREEDAPYFYGRELFTERLVEAVEERSLVGVVGPSGSGKSSVVFAGLLPHLRQASGLREAQGRAWAIAVCRPGATPFYSLATALVPRLEGEVSDTARLVGTQEMAVALRKGQTHLQQICADILDKSSQYGRLLLVVDQFEELFTLCKDTEERREFIDTLVEGIADNTSLTLVLTIRADFLGQAFSDRSFADAMQDADLILGPMTRGELSGAVVNPAMKLGVAFEAGLVDRILEDVGDEPGNLPLLEFALTQLWGEQKVGMLSHRAYEAIGGVEGALARYADQVYAGLVDSQQDQARRIFAQMVMPGEGTVDTRRLAKRDELGEGDWALVRELADARLVVTDLDILSGGETAEVVHEALIQGWGQLQEWMREDRAFRTWQERLRAAMRSWEASERDEGALLRGGPLVEAETWLEERGGELSEAERIYIEESILLRERQQAERERRRRVTVIALTTGLIIAVILSIFAFQQRQSARTQAGILLASQAEAELEAGYTDRAILLALEALENYPYTPQAEHALGQAVTHNRILGFYEGHNTAITGAAWSSDGSRVATSSTDNSLHIWNPTNGETITEINLPDGITGNIYDWGLAIKWSSDDRYLLTISGDRFLLGSQDYDLILWEVETGKQVATYEVQNATLPDAGDAGTWFYHYTTGAGAAFTRDGRLAVLGGDNSALILAPMLGDEQVLLRGHTSAVNGVDWSPDEKTLATASEDGTARVWDVDSGEELMQLAGHEGGVNQVAWSPKGDLLATAGDDGTVRFWDAANGKHLTEMLIIPTEENVAIDERIVYSLAWSPDGDYLATGTGDGFIRIWNTNSNEMVVEMKGHDLFVTYLTWSPLDERLVSAGADGRARVWNGAPDNRVLNLPYEHILYGGWSADGTYIAVGTSPGPDKAYQGLVSVWDFQAGKPLFETTVDKDGSWEWMADYSPAGDLILARTIYEFPDLTDANRFYLLDSRNGEVVRMLETYTDTLLLIPDWSPDGRQVGVGDWGGTAYYWDVNSGELIKKLDCFDWVQIVRWSPDGKKIAMQCSDDEREINVIRVIDAGTFETTLSIERSWWEDGGFGWINWSPDSTRLVVAGGDDQSGTMSNPVYVFDASSGEELLEIARHTRGVWAANWSPDGKRLVSSSTDDTTRIWDAETGVELLTISTPGDWIIIPVWSPDGQHLLVYIDNYTGGPGRSGVWRVWQTKEELIDYAKECCVFRELTDAERQQFGLPER